MAVSIFASKALRSTKISSSGADVSFNYINNLSTS